ncbi:tetratricopeptide (TPR) repeat protein [Sphingomonas leidyi]|uniref:Tetratricopeptide (TPR) repeat protein n=1 Tax=Sphingomonas leidyi TaxID=68569 RepID=A0A7X5ZXN2_9SPHN|nr:tetratricopeptide repeat protein [Sphingomonas leidyi]NIJ67452.1 tetratricopeptide (TPR) repeat protein [Sphingomonas leidyi]
MLPFLILALQAVPAAAPAKPAPAPALVAPEKEPPRFTQCMDLATGDPVRGQMDAIQWRTTGGGVLARQCLGVAYANQEKWAAAAGAFEDAAREAETGKDPRAPNYWASAGNAWIAAGDPTKARAAIDAALATGTLAGLDLGEAHLDRARAMVAAGDMEAARSDIDKALTYADKDPLAWLLSATLARRAGDLGRAARDVTEALRRAPDDPSVQLEAGNVAAASGNEADARTAWNRAIELAPGTGIATAARKALEQFSATEK